MIRQTASIAWLTVVSVFVALDGSASAWQAATQKATPKKQSKEKASGATLTGCMDQQDGNYVLVDDHGLNVIASLEAEGFPTEGFAKHLGHKVIVRGTSSPSGARPVFKVRSIETVSDTCAPQL